MIGFRSACPEMATLGGGAAGSTLLTGLVAYWKLDETSGTRVASVGFNLTDNNTVLSGTGKQGNAADFESSASEYLSAANAICGPIQFSGNQDFTVAFWCNMESKTGDPAMVSKFEGSQRSWEVWYNSAADLIEFTVSGNGTTRSAVTSLLAMTVGLYRLVYCWHDATADTINIKLDNGAVASTSHTTGVFNSTTPFIVGAEPSAGSAVSYFDGLIDELGIWNRVLTGAEIITLYNTNAGITYPF
jgi:hypothetical protein